MRYGWSRGWSKPETCARELTRAFAAEFAAKVDRDTVEVAKRILNDSTALPATAATLVNLLAERSNAFEGA